MKKAIIILIPLALAAVAVWVFLNSGKPESQPVMNEGQGVKKEVIPDKFLGRKKHRLKIVMEAPIDSQERAERFEKPLEKALGDIGQIDGSGSMIGEVDGKYVVARCEIDLSVDDLKKGKAIVWQVLKEAGAPEKTVVEEVDREESLQNP